MERNGSSKLNTQIYEEACEWFVTSRAGDLGEAGRRELDRWLRQSPEHVSAYLEIAAIWNEGPALDTQRSAETLVANALADRRNVSRLPVVSEERPPSHEPGHERVPNAPSPLMRRWALAASIAACIVIVGILAWSRVLGIEVHSTKLGEQRSIVLADGSTVDLNSRSRVRVRYDESSRAIELVEGQALFHVAKDPARPFVVTSGDLRVRAVGTQFDVYKKISGTVVSVVEGRVAILSTPLPGEAKHAPVVGSDSAGGVVLSAGKQVTVSSGVLREVSHPNIAAATAWKQRQIVFESASLSEVAEEFNRYNARELVIEDPDAFRFHVSGVFASTDPGSLVRFLRGYPGLEVLENRSKIRILKKDGAGEVTDR
jgi:transmembrane sensor